MTFTAATQTIESVLTDQGRDLFARSLLGQLSFRLSGFGAGRGGYQTGVPVWIDPPDPNSTALLDPVHPIGGGVAALVQLEQPYPNVIAAVCRLNRADALYGLGEVGLYARVVRTGTFAQSQYVNGAGGILFIARQSGVAGNSAQYSITNAGADQILTISTIGTVVTVTLATDSLGNPTSTMQQTADAVTSDISANQVMSAAPTGIVSTVAAPVGLTSLAGGTDPTLPYILNQDYLIALAHMPLVSKTDKTVLVFRWILAT